MLKTLRKHRQKSFAALSALFCLTLGVGVWTTFPTERSDAAIADWIRGASLQPRSPEDFASENFKRSIWNLKEAGATYVGLTVPWQMSSGTSNEVVRGATTPSDAALIDAINYAHSIGLKVMIKIHVEATGTPWRAHINPTNRAAWYQSYGDMLVHNARLAESHHVELVSLGTEMISMAQDNAHPGNTAAWRAMIARVRAVYSGKITYGAHGNGDEDQHIKFWDALDYISTSPYYFLNVDSDKSISSLKASWEQIIATDIKPLADQYGKPFLFGEIGFRSVPDVHIDPWNSQRKGPVDEAEQARNYAAMISVLKDRPWFAGIMLWDWDSNPAVGGVGDTNYTPYGKQAGDVMQYMWAGTGSPVSTSIKVYYPQVKPGEPVIVESSLLNMGPAISGAIVDVEVYNSSGAQVHQQVYHNVNLDTEVMRRLSFDFIPQNEGEYRVSVGVFSSDWSTLYKWGHHRAIFNATYSSGSRSTLRVVSTVPSVLRQGSDYNLQWTDTAGDPRYNILLRKARTGEQYAIKWVVTPTVYDNGVRSFNWKVGEFAGEVPQIPGEYYFTVCHDYSAPCISSQIFKLEPAANLPSTITVTSPMPATVKEGETVGLTWQDTAPNNGRDNVYYSIILRAKNGATQYPLNWYYRAVGDGAVTKRYDWKAGESLAGKVPAGEYFLTVCHDYPGKCNYSSNFKLEAGGVVQPTEPFSMTVNSAGTGVSLRNNNSTANTVLVDLELYDNQGRKTSQKFWDNETFGPGESKEYSLGPLFLTPSDDPYHFHVGIFQTGWQGLIRWYHDAKIIEVAS